MPNRTLPEFWRYDPTISRLRVHTREFLFRLALAMDDYWRCFVGTHPNSPEYLRATLYPLNAEVRLTDVARSLAEAQAAGVLLVRDSERGWYVELSEPFRYRKDDYTQRQPRHGPRKPLELKAPSQSELPLVPVVLPPAHAPKKSGAGKSSKHKGIDHDHGNDHESARSAENRGLSPGQDSESIESKRARGVFSRGLWSKPTDDVWRDVCRFFAGEDISCDELFQNGALWLARLEQDRPALAEAVIQGRLLEQEKFAFANKGEWLTAEFEKLRRKTG